MVFKIRLYFHKPTIQMVKIVIDTAIEEFLKTVKLIQVIPTLIICLVKNV